MRTSVPIVALLASLLLPVAACGGSGETYLRFQADGRSFREEGVGQYVEPVSGHPGRFAVSIDPDDLERKPRASVSFHQFMDGPSAIGGRTVDLSEAPDDMAPALAVFDLGDDVTVTPRLGGYTFTIRFGPIEDGFVSGSFSGDGFTVGSSHGQGLRPTSVSGRFRARLVTRRGS